VNGWNPGLLSKSLDYVNDLPVMVSRSDIRSTPLKKILDNGITIGYLDRHPFTEFFDRIIG
jgi:hypothetical protein